MPVISALGREVKAGGAELQDYPWPRTIGSQVYPSPSRRDSVRHPFLQVCHSGTQTQGVLVVLRLRLRLRLGLGSQGDWGRLEKLF